MATVIFDLDGTLADTSGDLIAAANACFERLGHGPLLDPVADQLTAFHGGRAMLRLGFGRIGIDDEKAVDQEFPMFIESYAANIDHHTSLYPGAMESVEQLKSDGYKVGICTNKPEALAHTLLTRMDVRDHFASLIGADTLPVRKPDPEPLAEAVRRAGGDPANCLLVGDTVTDVKTAAALGCPSVLVTFGPEGEAISRLNPTALLNSYADLPPLAARLLR